MTEWHTQPPAQVLDLRTTPCPLNFVKTKLALEKLSQGDVLEVWLDPASQSVMNIPQSLGTEGYREILQSQESETLRLRILATHVPS